MQPDIIEFAIHVTRTDDSAVVSVIGELDLGTAPRLSAELNGLVESGILAVTVDMARLDFIDSTGLSVLVIAMKRLRARGGDLALHAPSPRAMTVLEITGLTKVFAVSLR